MNKRAPFHLQTPVKNLEHVFLTSIFRVEKLVEPLGAPHLESFGDHDGPGDDGKNDQAENNDFCFGCGLIPHVKQFRLLCWAACSGKKNE